MDIKNLPSDPEKLKAIIARLVDDKKILEFKVQNLLSKLFGKKSEKWTEEEKNQALLFDEADAFLEPVDPLESYQEVSLFSKVASHSRKKPGRVQVPEHFPVEEILHDIPESEKVCKCGAHLTSFGSEKVNKVDILPPQIKVLRHIRPKYVCKSCHGLENVEESAIKIAPPIPQFLPKAIADKGMLAYTITSKFCDAIPFYRLSNIFTRYGFEISRTTLCNYARDTAERLEYLEEEFWKELLASPVLQIDETPVRVLKEQQEKDSKSYMFVIRGGTRDKPILKFIYHPTRSIRFLEDRLQHYKGILLTDGFGTYDSLVARNPHLKHAGCWVHARREFMDILKDEKSNSIAKSMVEKIGLLYKIDDQAKILSLEEKANHRTTHSKPIVEEIRALLHDSISKSFPSYPISKAMRYMDNQWDKLVLFLEFPELPLDTNAVENAIRPFVIGRKNWLFSGSPEGAKASGFLYSLVETAKANGKEPFSYLKNLFSAVEMGEKPSLLEVG